MLDLHPERIAAFKALGFTDDDVIKLIEQSHSQSYITKTLADKSISVRFKAPSDQPTAPNPKLAQFTEALAALDPAAQNALLDQCLAAAQQAALAAPKGATTKTRAGLLPWPW